MYYWFWRTATNTATVPHDKMECYFSVKSNELLIHSITWMDLKNMWGGDGTKEYLLCDSSYIKFYKELSRKKVIKNHG